MRRIAHIPRKPTGRVIAPGGMITSALRGVPYPGGPGDYVNPTFSGGAISGPSAGSNPPTGHGIGFNTVESGPIPVDAWEINDARDAGRSFLTYDLPGNHPGLQPGDVAEFSWLVENFDPVALLAVNNAATIGATVTFPVSTVPPNRRVRVKARVVIDDAGYTCTLRVGMGVTTTGVQKCVISQPSLRITPGGAP